MVSETQCYFFNARQIQISPFWVIYKSTLLQQSELKNIKIRLAILFSNFLQHYWMRDVIFETSTYTDLIALQLDLQSLKSCFNFGFRQSPEKVGTLKDFSMKLEWLGVQNLVEHFINTHQWEQTMLLVKFLSGMINLQRAKC